MHYALCTMHYSLCTIHYALYTMHYALCIRICTYSYVFTILYVFTISRGNPVKSRDFGTHAYLSSRRVTLSGGGAPRGPARVQ